VSRRRKQVLARFRRVWQRDLLRTFREWGGGCIKGKPLSPDECRERGFYNRGDNDSHVAEAEGE
jgi:hypothetical protein